MAMKTFQQELEEIWKFQSPKIGFNKVKHIFADENIDIEECFNLVVMVKSIPPEWLPRTDDEIKCFKAYSPYVTYMNYDNERIHKLFMDFKSDWVTYSKANVKLMNPNNQDNDTSPIAIARHIGAFLKNSLHEPLKNLYMDFSTIKSFLLNYRRNEVKLLFNSNEPHVSPRLSYILFRDMQLHNIIETVQKYHQKRNNVVNFGFDIPHNASWVPFTNPYTATNGMTISFLVNRLALQHEGSKGKDDEGFEGLNHCVGGYDAQCYFGTSHIASVRYPDRRRASTVEFNYTKENLVQRQHAGYGNSAPPVEAVDAIAEWLYKVKNNVVAINDLTPTESHIVIVENISNEIKRLFDFWHEFLPRGKRDLDFDNFYLYLIETCAKNFHIKSYAGCKIRHEF